LDYSTVFDWRILASAKTISLKGEVNVNVAEVACIPIYRLIGGGMAIFVLGGVVSGIVVSNLANASVAYRAALAVAKFRVQEQAEKNKAAAEGFLANQEKMQ
jgi:hypothetical protein